MDEADETVGWLEMLEATLPRGNAELKWLLGESRELRAIFLQSVKTAKLKSRLEQHEPAQGNRRDA